MKKLTSWIIILLPFFGISQNYQVVSKVLPAHYISELGYNDPVNVKTFAIDSIVSQSPDTLVYTFKTINDTIGHGWASCVDSSGGSLMGSVLLQQPQRTLLFNHQGDTINVYHNTNINDKWVYYKYSNGDYLEAGHTKTEYMSVAYSHDSVKTFELIRRDYEGNEVEDVVNGFEIQLGKELGLIQAFDNYIFPRELLKCYLSGWENPKSGILDVNARTAYDFEVGDEFHYYKEDLIWFLDMDDTTYKIEYGQKRWIIRYVNERIDFQDSVTYKYTECSRIFEYADNEYDTVYLTETVFETIVFDSVLPGIIDAYSNQKVKMEGWGVDAYYEIIQRRTTKYNYRTTKGIVEGMYMIMDSCLIRSIADPCCYSELYVEGCGGPYYRWSNWFNSTIEEELLYFNKNGDVWGEPIAEDCEDLLSDITESVSPKELCLIYPNPFSDVINVESIYDNQSFRLIRLYDINGVLIDSYETDTGKFQLNTRDLPKGFYVIELIFKDNTILRQKIVKN